MTRYAEKTSVSATRSAEEIERIVTRYGANQFITGRDDEAGMAYCGFRIRNISVKIGFPIPRHEEFKISPAGRKRKPDAIRESWEQAYRQRWRAMALVIKAKLEAAAAGISTIEKEFLPDILLPGGRTITEILIPQLEETIRTGKMPLLIEGPR